MKKLLLFLLTLLTSLMAVSGAQFYTHVEFSYEAETPNSVYVTGGECINTDCSTLNDSNKFYSVDAFSCWNSQTLAQFNSCMQSYELTNGVASNTGVLVREDLPTVFGYATYFYTSDDTYLPVYSRASSYTCDSQVCLDPQVKTFEFHKKHNAIAEIGQLNIINLDDPEKPIQVEVPVSINETVCSAFRFSEPDMFQPPVKSGYSDYSANTLITLEIFNANTNTKYREESITLPIRADTCAGLAAFSWTPDSSLENANITFKVTTDVIDDQVANSIEDYAYITETIYPEDLDGTCWVRAHDFTLSNEPQLELTPSLAQITQGESLYAIFRAAAFKDENKTPIPFQANISLISNISSSIQYEYEFDGTNLIHEVLRDERFDNDIRDEDYEQSIVFSENVEQTQRIKTGNFMTYTLEFDDSLQFTSNFEEDLIGGEIEIMGVDFTISEVDFSSSIEEIVLVGGSNKIALGEGESGTYVVNGNSYEIKIIKVDPNEVLLEINGQQYTIDEYSSRNIQGLVIGVTELIYSSRPQVKGYAELVLDAKELTLDDGEDIEINGEEITVYVDIIQTANNWSGFTFTYENSGSQINLTTQNYIEPVVGQIILGIDTTNKVLISSQNLMSGNDLETYVVNLSDEVRFAPEGTYEVELLTNPIAANCNIKTNVTQVQKLEILGIPQYEVAFYVRDENSNNLENIEINLTLLDADDNFQDEPTYSKVLTTNSNGYTLFDDVIAGNYRYIGTRGGNRVVAQDIHIASHMNIYLTLTGNNTAPVIDLPAEFTEYYLNTLEVDLRNYVTDFTHSFDELTFTAQVTSGTGLASITNGILEVSTTQIGDVRVKVIAKDPLNLEDSDEILVHFVDNEVPVVSFVAIPDNGDAPFSTSFSIDVVDDDTAHNCTLEFGDGNQVTGDCTSLDNTPYTYTTPQTYIAELTVTDGVHTVNVSEEVFVFERTSGSPLIRDFTLDSTNGNFVPTDLTLSWDIIHEDNLSMNCTLRINGNNTPVSCIDSLTLSNFNVTGTSSFSIIAIDTNSVQVQRILRENFEEIIPLGSGDAKLDIDSIIIPGDFDFRVVVSNESMSKRQIYVRPSLECSGVTIPLSDPQGVLSTSAISKKGSQVTQFEFHLNTQDFKANIPKNTVCEFTVVLIDDFGSEISLTKDVEFRYETTEAKIQSIRGEGTDIINYMASAVLDGVKSGYNFITFQVENNKFEGKKLSMTMMSSELGLRISEEMNLGSEQTREVQMTIFIKKGTKPGMYPLRISVYDGEEHQTRYTYLKVK